MLCCRDLWSVIGPARKRALAEGNYQQRKEYCDECLEEIVASAPCRNVGCKSIGGAGMVEATFGDQLFYEKKQFTFPPNNCVRKSGL